jgi:integrase
MAVKLIDVKKKKYRIAFWYKRKHYTKVVTGNRKLAEAVERQIIKDLEEGRYFPERKFRERNYDEVAGSFLTECPTFKKSVHKVEIYLRGLKTFFKGKMMKDIQSRDVVRLREHLGQRMTPVSVNHYHRILRRVFNWAIQENLFKGENPASGTKVKLANERPYWRTNFLGAEDLKRLLEAAEDRIAPIVLCAALTGMRLSEIKRMKKEDVDLNQCVIRIPESKNGESGWVPIPETLYVVLSPIINSLPEAGSLVFDFCNFERMWKRARKKAGLTLHFHDLRHTYGSHLMMKSGNHGAVQALLRHKSPGMTQRYAHLAPNFLRKTVLTLDAMFQDEKPEPALPAARGVKMISKTITRASLSAPSSKPIEIQ